MPRSSKRPATWLEIAVSNVGIRKGTTALVWAYQWAVTRESAGHEPTVEEVAEWWSMNLRKAYREQAVFREAFPMLDTPAQIYASDEVRAALHTQATLADNLQDPDRRHRAPSPDLGAIRIGSLPANL